MEAGLAKLFLYELKEQCNFAMKSYDDFVTAYKSRDSDGMWIRLELFLIAASKISLIFWPWRGDKQRGQDLRNLLQVDENVAFSTRGARNVLEHYDERLEEWHTKSQHHNVMDKTIIPETTINTGNFDYLRTFLTKRFVFKFLSEEYEINPIKDSIVELLPKVERELNKLFPKDFP